MPSDTHHARAAGPDNERGSPMWGTVAAPTWRRRLHFDAFHLRRSADNPQSRDTPGRGREQARPRVGKPENRLTDPPRIE
ncbi:unnamed protein product [marine sediment metagenome]|uniref:Uncharacterized protein n=1 Tax=marine sediment metagenome TaxID=412755 RepID=X0XF40_9ZZZZ